MWHKELKFINKIKCKYNEKLLKNKILTSFIIKIKFGKKRVENLVFLS